MKRVFHIITHLDVGGAERVAINLVRTDTEGIETHIVEVIRGRGAFSQQMIGELQEAGIRYNRSWLPLLFSWHYLCEKIVASLFPFRMFWLWLRYRPDVVHCHTEIPDMALWLSLKLMPWMRFRLVRTIHNTRLWTGMGFVGPRVERLMQRRRANIAISEGVRESYQQAYGESAPIIFNGVEPSPQLGYDGLVTGKRNILFAGRLEEQKGIATLVEIVRQMESDPRYHFHIFGNGRLQPLVDAIADLKNVTVRPPLHNLSQHIAAFDYVIMPSIHEGLSILALEASANKVPLLINRCAGLTDTLPPDWPLAVDNNDITQWTNLLRNTLTDSLHDETSDHAFHFVSTHFSIRGMQQSYEHFYNT